MLIATKTIDLHELLIRKHDAEGLHNYIKSLVPDRLKHIDAIYRNTCYYCNYKVLSSNDLKMEDKKLLSDILTTDLRVVGYMGVYIDVSEIEILVNWNSIDRYKKGDKDGSRI